jgi:predicted nucleotide-binding protein
MKASRIARVNEDRKNVAALHEPGVEIPSDLNGILYISLASD